MMYPYKPDWRSYLFCFFIGALLTLGFMPNNILNIIDLSWLGILCPGMLLTYWCMASARQAFWQGLCFGLGLFGIGVSWVYISIHTYGNANWLCAGLITGAFILLLSLFTAVTGYLLKRCADLNHFTGLCFAFPLIWTAGELLRSYLFTGFPWLLLGSTQTTSFLGNYAPIFGVYGVSFITALSTGLLTYVVLHRGREQRRQTRISFGIFVLIWLLGGFGLNHIQWTTIDNNQPIKVSLIQGNIPLSMKWDPQSASNIANTYANLTLQHWNNVVIWPENALPIFPAEAQPFLNALARLAQQHNSAILTGLPVYKPDPDRYYNGAMVFGNGSGEYLKYHLVPFGEYVPLDAYFGRLLQFLKIPMSDFSAGPYRQSLVQMLDFPVAVFTCYEIAYAAQIRDNLQNAAFIATISDDSWFGHSLGALQQEQIAQMRALETGRYVLSASNDGMTAIINERGDIVAQAPRYTRTVLSGTIYPATGQTPWVRYGYWPLSVLVLLSLILWRSRRPKF